MPHNPLEEDDEPYVSAEDSDFAPDDVQDADSGESDAEEAATSQKRKQEPIAEADDGDNSGDEAIINKGKKKLKRAKYADDDGGEGGLIKTRRQRAEEKEERKIATSTGPVTVDVDSLWEQMRSGQPIIPERQRTPERQTGAEYQREIEVTPIKNMSPEMIKIKRTYNFAGQVHTEEKMVARDSAEAKLYLASQGDQAPVDTSPPKRVTKKAFRSVFEPVLDTSAKRTDLNLGVAARMQAAKEAQAKKLNTVEKSRMDWAGFVDKEGIKDELEFAGKSKDSFAARQDFLARSEAIREEDSRKARLSGRT